MGITDSEDIPRYSKKKPSKQCSWNASSLHLECILGGGNARQHSLWWRGPIPKGSGALESGDWLPIKCHIESIFFESISNLSLSLFIPMIPNSIQGLGNASFNLLYVELQFQFNHKKITKTLELLLKINKRIWYLFYLCNAHHSSGPKLVNNSPHYSSFSPIHGCTGVPALSIIHIKASHKCPWSYEKSHKIIIIIRTLHNFWKKIF